MELLNVIPHPLVGTPFGTALDLCLVGAAFCWLISIITRECSWIDRLWSIMPPVYCLIVANDLGFEDARVNVVTLLVCLWSARLTFNYAIKGGYWFGGEDYRWEYVRKQLGPVKFQLLNFFFVAWGQMLVIWLFTSPIHVAWSHREVALGWLDYTAIAVFLFFLVIETIADAQMWFFQRSKKQRTASGEEVTQPFIDSGLFALCRHPSYTAEIGMWTTIFVFGAAASGQIIHWSGLGFLLLLLIFIGSTRLTENISSDKYETYKDYQASVPKFLPFTAFGKNN